MENIKSKKFQKKNNSEKSINSKNKNNNVSIREVKMENKNEILIAKLVKEDKNKEDKNKEDPYEKLKGPNFIKIEEIKRDEHIDKDYKLIIMEKAMGNIEELYHDNLLLKLRFNPFNKNLGDNLLRFFSKQIIDCLEIMDRNYYVHFNIRPDNILIFQNLIIKLSGFSLITKVKENQELKIPKGKKPNFTPEYFLNTPISKEDAKKQDYFSLGSTLFFLIYGIDMFKKYGLNSDEKEKNDDKNSEIERNRFKINYILSNIISQIESDQTLEKDLIEFLHNLLNYTPEERPNFESIYRNKWLNKNNKEQREIMIINHNDDKKAIIEFQKSDFLIKNKKEKDLNKNKKKFKFKRK